MVESFCLLRYSCGFLRQPTVVYGHSHINRQVFKDNTMYINNAFGYPDETQITAKELKCVFET